MTEQECRAFFFQQTDMIASQNPEVYRGFKLGMKAEREECAKVCESKAEKLQAHLDKAENIMSDAAVVFTGGNIAASKRNAAAIRARGQE